LALDSGARDKDVVRNELQMKLTAAAFAEATSMKKWDAERQQFRDEIARAQREERRAKQDCDEALETIRRAKTEDDEYQQWRIRRVRGSRDRGTSRPLENPISPSNRLFSRSSREATTPVRGHPDKHSSASGQKALGADTPRAGANPHRGSRDKQPDEAGKCSHRTEHAH
jgi:hypothetical protein